MFGYLSSALAALPFPTQAAGFLSSALQNRILHYLLKRALGQFIKDGDLKLDQIEAGIMQGKVEIRSVHLNVEFINNLLRSTPLRIDYGLVGSISIHVPWTNLRTGDFSIIVDGIDTAFTIVGSQKVDGADGNLSESLLDVAEDVFEQDEEGREIEESIASLVDQQGQQTEAPSQTWAAYVVSLVDSLISRLQITTKNISVRFKNQGEHGNAPIDIQLRLDSLLLKPEDGQVLPQELYRTLKVNGVSLWIDDKSSDDGMDQDDKSSSSSSESYMEESKADLRSTIYDSTAQSMYASAHSGMESEMKSKMKIPTISFGPQLIARLVGSDSMEFHFAMIRRETGTKISSVNISVSAKCGLAAILLTPDSLASFLRFCQDASSTFTTQIPSQRDSIQRTRNGMVDYQANIEIESKGFHLVSVYDLPSLISPSDFQTYHESVEEYWARPSRIGPAAGHLRVRVQDLQAKSTIKRESSLYNFQIGDIGIYEQLSPSTSTDDDISSTLPIVIFDKELTGDEENEERVADFERDSISTVDWRTYSPKNLEKGKNTNAYRRTDFSELGWKLKSPNRRNSLSLQADRTTSVEPAIQAIGSVGGSNEKDDGDGLKIQTLPAHFFVDITTIDRILPLVHHLGLKARPQGKTDAIAESLASSFETVHANLPEDRINDRNDDDDADADEGGDTKDIPIHLTSDLIRIEVRISTTTAKDVTNFEYGKAVALRSGIMTVDLRNIGVLKVSSPSNLKEKTGEGKGVHFETSENPASLHSMYAPQMVKGSLQDSTKVSVEHVKVYFADAGSSVSKLFTYVGPLQSDDESDKPLLPQLDYKTSSRQNGHGQNTADCQLPMVQVALSKALLDRIELMADDLSIWLTQMQDWRMNSEVDNATEALRMLGSRFFGVKQSTSTLSSSSELTEIGLRQTSQMPLFSLRVLEINIRLQLSVNENDEDARFVRMNACETIVKFDAQYAPNSTRTSISIASVDVTHSQGREGTENKILERTMHPTLTRRATPMITIQITSTTEPGTSFRGSQIDILTQNFTLTYDWDDTVFYDLLAFSRSPEGAFEHVQPSEMTRIVFQIKEMSIVVTPPNVSALSALTIGHLTLRTKLVSDYPRSNLRITMGDSCLLLGESAESIREREARARRSVDVWTSRGLFRVVNLDEVNCVIILSKLTRPEVDVKMTKLSVEVMACADTIELAQKIVNALPIFSQSNSTTKRKRVVMQSHGDKGFGVDDIFRSISENSFKRPKGVNASIDLLDDDVPRHPAFLHQDNSSSRRGPMDAILDEDFLDEVDAESENGKPNQPNQRENSILLQNDVVTVRLLNTESGIAPSRNFFTDPNLIVSDETSKVDGQAASFRFSLQDGDLIVRLFSGYDLASTRSAIEDEAKRVRRRLQKIQQMLDQGQVPDDSVEEAAASLFDSVHLPLPHGKAAVEMGAGELIQIVDEEIDNRSETASSTSTWKQFVPGRIGSSGSSTPTKRKRSKMARSRESMIDMEFKGIRMEYEVYRPIGNLSSRTSLQIAKMRIVDNVPTSTWQTFLTGMASSSQGIHSPTNAKDMVKVEITNVLPTSDNNGDAIEVRCKARISPLRLHVDQDALDFLKKFFMFEVPKKKSMDSAQSIDYRKTKDQSIPGPFIQHAEIYAIKIKLDYKPKRVDYRLIREGKTIEMMNFFNFEGSLISLRHLTLRGIMGWPKLFDTLNDLWTPDVKSNQLADVLSGITPIRSLVNVGNGMVDLVLLPIEQYQRDGNIGRGLREGAKRFVKTTALEAARIGARLASGTQVILERAENVLGSGVTGREGSSSGTYVANVTDESRFGGEEEYLGIEEGEEEEEEGQRGLKKPNFSRFANQPNDLRQALDEAQRGLSRGFNEAAQTILAVPMEVYDRRAGEGGSRPVVRAVPIAILHSAAGTSEAISKTLQGVHRELSGAKLAEEEEEKYKKPNSKLSSNTNKRSAK